MGEKQLLEITNKLKEILSNDGGVKEFKNLKDACTQLGIVYKTSGKAQKLIKRNLERVCDIHKAEKGNSLIVTKVYNEPTEKIDLRKNNTSHNVKYKQFLGGGIYKIQLDNKVYIGQTIKFNQRYENHRNNYKNNPKTNELLKQGATFEPLEIIENTQDKNFMYTREQYWYDYYKNLGYDMVNAKAPIKSKTEELKRYKGKKARKRNPYIYKHFKIKKEDYPKLLELLKDSDIQLY